MRMSLAIFILIVCILTIPPAMTTAQQDRGQRVTPRRDIVELPGRSKRWALVVGVDKYDSTRITPLIGASNDAKELADALVNHAGFPAEQVIVLSSKQPDGLKPTRNAIIAQLANLNGVVPADGLFLFAFSGHGVEAGENGYLLPADAVSAERNARFLEQTAVPVNYVKDEIRSYGVRQVIVLLDSCRNDPRADKAGGDNLMAAPLAESFDFDRRNSEIEGFITFYATRSKMRAHEDPVRRQGYFSHAFVEALKGAAANDRGEVTLANLIKYLEEKVPIYVKRDHGRNAQQTPRTTVDGFRAPDLVLAITAPPPRPPRIIDPCEKEDEAWERIRKTGNAAVVRAFLNEYPNCVNARNARVLLAELESPAPPRPEPPAARMSVAGVALSALALFTTVKVDASGKIIERHANQESWGYAEDLGNGVKLEMVEIAPGEFQMGGVVDSDEKPIHKVRVSGFLMGKFEVTQEQWAAVARLPKVKIELNADPSRFKGAKLPVENVSWEEAQEFCARLSRKTGGNYRLPSEAEWEYAARAGTTTPFAFGATVNPEIVNYDGDYPYGSAAKGVYRQKTVDVGSLGAANAWGLFDMHGNAWEWCEDDYHNSYNGAPTDGSAWKAADTFARGWYRVVRGGGWDTHAVYCRSAHRGGDAPGNRNGGLGFRLLRTYR